MEYTVKQVSGISGVSVRTLHHYHRVGLLEPTRTTRAGYRIYTEPDLERLQQILYFRELGFELRRIKEVMEQPGFDRRRALAAHRELLLEKRQRINNLIELIDTTIEHIEGNQAMNGTRMFEAFDDSKIEEHIERYRDEVIERYGAQTVEESERRVRQLSPDDWNQISKETADINQNLANLMDSHDPADPDVQLYVERWFALLNRYFSTYTAEVFRGLGDLYVDDERFTAHYEAIRPGLARFLRDGMHAFADRAVTG